jgi:sulfoxide reductase heme-binding subunit YedZ
VKDTQFAKMVVFVNSLVPAALLAWAWLADRDELGINPVEYTIHTTGFLTIIFVLLTLAITPLRKITGFNWLAQFRRMIGLFAFFYCCIHFLSYLALQRHWSMSEVITDTVQRKFIFFGMAALLMMLPLAATSTTSMIKRIGGQNWKRLHRLIYLVGICAIIHFLMFGKIVMPWAKASAVVLIILFIYRIADRFLPGLHYRRRIVP